MTETGDIRYSRQEVLAELGVKGQQRLAQSSVLIVGCGGLGSTISQLLVRGGVGRVFLVDKDVVERHNLHRQLLYDEADVDAGSPKVEIARRKLEVINSSVEIHSQAIEVGPTNVSALLDGVQLVLDGTDNVETRYLLNDACLEKGIPWVYGGAVGTSGMTMNILPKSNGPCLRCVFPEPPPPGTLPTCDTRGILNALPVLVASRQACEAFKILTESPDVSKKLCVVDPWKGTCHYIEIRRVADCPACGLGRRDFLGGPRRSEDSENR